MRTFNCRGVEAGEGTGFLVGTGVVMTARHVIKGACHIKVFVDGTWMTTNGATSWYSRGHGDVDIADVATIRLHGQASGYVFKIRSWSVGVGDHVSALGHPLGENISLTQGQVIYKAQRYGVPMLMLRLLGAEGSSGSPLVDDNGNVVGILQIGLGGHDVLGQRTSGAIVGIDLPAWWPNARTNLCKAYPGGGIPGCPTTAPSSPPPEPAPTPAPAPTPVPPQTPPPVALPTPTSWLPTGFTIWTGEGDYRAGAVASETASCSQSYATSAGCWGVNVVSEYGCNSGAFVNVDIYDSNGLLVDTGIDEIPVLAAGQIGLAEGDSFDTTAASFRVTEINCFNF